MIVDNTDINTIEEGQYISIEFRNSFKSLKLLVDYGQPNSIFKNNVVKDENGKSLRFYSKTHAFNVLADNGWVYIDNYSYVLGDLENHSYLFKKYE